jgi:hypothetical protein
MIGRSACATFACEPLLSRSISISLSARVATSSHPFEESRHPFLPAAGITRPCAFDIRSDWRPGIAAIERACRRIWHASAMNVANLPRSSPRNGRSATNRSGRCRRTRLGPRRCSAPDRPLTGGSHNWSAGHGQFPAEHARGVAYPVIDVATPNGPSFKSPCGLPHSAH